MIKLIGASGHAKVILDILEASGRVVNGFYDDNVSITSFKGLIRSGIVSDAGSNLDDLHIISIGVNSTRQKIAKALKVGYTTAIHPSAVVSNSASIDQGTVVMAGAVINSDTKIGQHCIINTQCSIDHDCTIDDFVHISPNTCLTGGVHVGEGVHIGAGAVVIPGVKIGAWATVGAGSVVIKDVPKNATVVGNPARVIKTA